MYTPTWLPGNLGPLQAPHPVCGRCCGRQLCQPLWAADESCQAACCCVGRARVMVGALNQRQQAGWWQRLQQIFLLLHACMGKACMRCCAALCDGSGTAP